MHISIQTVDGFRVNQHFSDIVVLLAHTLCPRGREPKLSKSKIITAVFPTTFKCICLYKKLTAFEQIGTLVIFQFFWTRPWCPRAVGTKISQSKIMISQCFWPHPWCPRGWGQKNSTSKIITAAFSATFKCICLYKKLTGFEQIGILVISQCFWPRPWWPRGVGTKNVNSK